MTQTNIATEVERILYLLKLKQVTRWGFEREDCDLTESVAEHVYGLMVLARYFLPMLDAENKLDHVKIYDMILWHDTGEIETGDIPTFQKTQEHTNAEKVALEQVKAKSPAHIAEQVYSAAIAYESQDSPEAQFVKMLDKAEGAFELLSNLDVARKRFAKQKVSKEMFLNKRAFIQDTYPTVHEYMLEIANQLENHKTFCNQ